MNKRLLFITGGAILSLVLAVYGQAPQADTRPGKEKQKAAGAPVATAAASASAATSAIDPALLKTYCFACHSERAKAAGLDAATRIVLEGLDAVHPEKDLEKWERVVHKLRAGMMPPSGLPRPKPEAFDKWISTVEAELDKHAGNAYPAPGLHRLNRTEYANVVRDLLAIEIDPTKYLPADDSTRGFDNIAGALTLSPALLEGYTSAASKISRVAMGDVNTPIQSTYRVSEDTSQDYHIEGMPFGTRGGMLVAHEFPADGEYELKVTPISKGNMGNTNPFGDVRGEKLEILLDGERLKVFDWDTERARADGTFNLKFPAKAGRHMVGVTFLATNLAPLNDLNKHFLRSTLETGGLPGYQFFPHVGKIGINGPFNAKGAADSPTRRKLMVCKPASAAQETACAKQIVNAVARRAYRRTITEQDTETLMSFYQQGRNGGGTFDNGIEMALRRVLADPDFVFRKETEPANVKVGQRYRISDTELASRLSFFLWSSIPDDELLNLATQNKLRDPKVLEAQVKRMLADPRSNQLVVNFAGQWLTLRALQAQFPTPSLYPDFDDNLRQAMRKEVELFVDSVVHEDRNVLDLMDANYTFLNERLAKHYGIPGVYGSNFRRVELGPEFDMRRGLIGKGSFSTTSSPPNRTSPVGRGKAVMQMFLGVEPPAPPPGVNTDLAAVVDAVHGKPTMRQQMELHRKNEPCMTCHKIMDPIGLAMESFDGIGGWRTMEEGKPIDTAGQLVDGTKINNVKDLRTVLKDRYGSQFVRVMADKLLIYALGRGTEYYDMPLMRSIVHDAEKNNNKFSAFVLGVVKSDPFQMNTKSAEKDQRASR